ncbi:uncharacterized protein LOC111335193 [Stylophora pistillata]|uniref:uncharacterized protein LOC111335193 n=1 Tax=Stylophora pistillata TaxID=50429 RepID=UPI000C053283|nr:uncharacterized protein LOC111335193 [Stylophora pistillata]
MDKHGNFLAKLGDAITGVVGATASGVALDFHKAAEKLNKIGDQSGYEDTFKMANTEKMKHLNEKQKQQDLPSRGDTSEFGIHGEDNCKDDDALADAAIEALHSSIGALKSLSTIMMNAALFWQKMQMHCESLSKGDVNKFVKTAMKKPKEERHELWTSTGFKTKAVRYYSKWVVLDDVCEV